MTPTRRQLILLVVFALGVAAVLYAFRSILVPFVLALVLAYVLSPVITVMTRIGSGRRRLPRWIAVVLLYLGLLGTVVFASVAVLPRLADEIGVMMKEVPAAFRHVREEWLPAVSRTAQEHLSPFLRSATPDAITQAEPAERSEDPDRPPALVLRPARDGSYRIELQDVSIQVRHGDDATVLTAVSPRRAPPAPAGFDIERSLTDALRGLLKKGQEQATVLLSVGQEIVLFLVKFTFSFFITLMISAFILVDPARIVSFFESLIPPGWRRDYRGLLTAVDRGLAGVIRGQLLICLVNGTLSGIGFAVADLRYWPVLTLVATIFTIVPIFGTVLSSIPAVFIALTDSWGTALFVLAWITLIHQLEANILNPKIIGTTARMHPVVVFFAIIAGERAAGLVGVLLGVPVASIIQNVLLYFRRRVYGDRDVLAPEAGEVEAEASAGGTEQDQKGDQDDRGSAGQDGAAGDEATVDRGEGGLVK